MHYKVMKGVSPKKAILDSSFPDKKRADARKKALDNSLRGSKTQVWVMPLEEGDPMNYRKKPARPSSTDYRGCVPPRVK